MMNERTEENVMREPLHKTRALWKMAEGGFASVYSVEEFILEHEIHDCLAGLFYLPFDY